ncbi:PIN domain-containing protein [Bacteroidota bacterium]
MSSIFVTDTSSLVSYFYTIFGAKQILSPKARRIIEEALQSSNSNIKLSIPSVVFIEIYDKWFVREEAARKLKYEFYEVIKQSPNVEIKPIEQEVLNNVLMIGDELTSHDIHDKIILASAIMLQCPLITTDTKLIDYIEKHKPIPYVR